MTVTSQPRAWTLAVALLIMLLTACSTTDNPAPKSDAQQRADDAAKVAESVRSGETVIPSGTTAPEVTYAPPPTTAETTDACQPYVTCSTSSTPTRAAGEPAYAGTYLVGSEIQPGTWVVEQSLPGCYWERTDSSGEIIDNNFVAGATRVQVTIRSTDYSFTNEGCGAFVRQ